MIKRKHKTDYQLIADAYKVSVYAVKRALERREEFPNNRLLKAYEKLQAAKLEAVAKMTPLPKMNAKSVAA